MSASSAADPTTPAEPSPRLSGGMQTVDIPAGVTDTESDVEPEQVSPCTEAHLPPEGGAVGMNVKSPRSDSPTRPPTAPTTGFAVDLPHNSGSARSTPAVLGSETQSLVPSYQGEQTTSAVGSVHEDSGPGASSKNRMSTRTRSHTRYEVARRASTAPLVRAPVSASGESERDPYPGPAPCMTDAARLDKLPPGPPEPPQRALQPNDPPKETDAPTAGTGVIARDEAQTGASLGTTPSAPIHETPTGPPTEPSSAFVWERRG